MGGCCSQGAPYIAYPCELPLQIQQTFTIDGKKKGLDVKLSLPPPKLKLGDLLELNDNTKVKVSLCGLTGFNARLKKECEYQDRAHCIRRDSSIFGFVLDGHGPRGREMAEICQIFFTDFFKTHEEGFQRPDENKVFEEMYAQCNEKLRETYAEENSSDAPYADWKFSGV